MSSCNDEFLRELNQVGAPRLSKNKFCRRRNTKLIYRQIAYLKTEKISIEKDLSCITGIPLRGRSAEADDRPRTGRLPPLNDIAFGLDMKKIIFR